LKEAEALRKEYFFSLAVGVKLAAQQRGKVITKDIQSVYERAKLVPYVQWKTILSEYEW
jgi:hypothetical protein